MPSEAGCERCAKCSQIDSAYIEVNETSWKAFGDGQCNWNEKEYGSEETVGQKTSMFNQLLYAS